TSRLILGSTLDGTTLPSGLELYDGTGTFRTGIQVNPATDFVGFFSGIYTKTAINESLIGNAYDNSASYAFLYDSSGNLRNGIEYNPPVNFNGFFSQDASGDVLSLLGNVLATTGILAPNDSLMELLDTSGTERLIEFQNSTNEGGVDFNAGSTTAVYGWG